jgi:PAS domain S-box-containing protein
VDSHHNILNLAAYSHTADALQSLEAEKTAILNATIELVAYLDTDLKVLWANKAADKSVGLNAEDLVGRYCYEIWGHGGTPCADCPGLKAIKTGQSQVTELSTVDGGIWLHLGCPVYREDNIVGVVTTALDITERKRSEEALQKREAELEAQSNHLQEVNTALKVLLKQREEDRSDLEEKVLSNVKQLVSPHLQRLKKSGLDTNQRSLVSILGSNLENIVSSFTSKLSSKSVGLTPMEIRTADLVKEGKTNKEIGEILCLSPNTVKFHRYNLRNKLGLKNIKINLRSHLLSLVK